jgi:diguanylate cyclase (GGDEF)-like protein
MKKYIQDWYFIAIVVAVLTTVYMSSVINHYGISRSFSIEEKWIDILGEGLCACFSFGWIILIIITGRIKKLNVIMLTGGILFYIGQVQDLIDEFSDLPPWGSYVEDIFFPAGLLLISIGVYNTYIYQTELIKEMTSLKDKYSKWSYIDDLTGLYNSRYLYEISIEKLHSALSQEEHLCVAMLDIDNFKKYNDTYGHLEGDQVLKRFGEVMNQHTGEKHIAFRYGGEEFLILFSDVDIETAGKIADEIREILSKVEFSPIGEPINCTVSIGVAEYRIGDDLKGFINRADQAMYRAKQNGKNRVFLDSQWTI